MNQQIELGEHLKEQAISRVEQGAGSEWFKQAMKCVRYVCINRPEFTTDYVAHIIKKSIEEPKEPRVIGALMRRAKKLGWCMPTDRMVKSKLPECHRRPKTVWRSMLL